MLMLLGSVLDNLFLTSRGVAAVFLTSVSRGGEWGLVMAAVLLTSVSGGQRVDCEWVDCEWVVLGGQQGPVQPPDSIDTHSGAEHRDRVPSEHNRRNEVNRPWRDVFIFV